MRILICIISFFFSGIVSADSSFSFTPPLTDLSVVFLSDIFGVVDGVLHGTGSQIMGEMFSVLNAAVLALGGIVIMYTLIVGTMNTAHEGEMLGHKWSSVWIPVRATLGLALLLPKASGYCLMQIFVMWVVLQGVGAADKVWEAALGYLNRGGSIIQAQSGATETSPVDVDTLAKLYTGAGVLLNAQACMYALQTMAETQRVSYNSLASTNDNICTDKPNNSNYQSYCNTSVPSFSDTVDFQQVQDGNPTSTTPYTVQMPNFPADSPYASFNGQCGSMTWSPISSTGDPNMSANNDSRTIAVQQVYDELGQVAERMVSNDPEMTSATPSSSGAIYATNPFGVPLMSNGVACVQSTDGCVSWGLDTSSNSSGSMLFIGSEFVGSVYDYNGIMMPALNEMNNQATDINNTNAKSFITKAQADGWMTAGAYFFDMVALNTSAIENANTLDGNSGFPDEMADIPLKIADKCSNATTESLFDIIVCNKHGDTQVDMQTKLKAFYGDGVDSVGTQVFQAKITAKSRKAIVGGKASTVYGFIDNASMVVLPGQPGIAITKLLLEFNPKIDTNRLHMDPVDQHLCNPTEWIIPPWNFGNCLLKGFMWLLYVCAAGLFNYVLSWMEPVLMYIVEVIVQLPLQLLSNLFTQGLTYIANPGDNPIVSLALMGNYYIERIMALWVDMFGISLMFAVLGSAGRWIIALASPIIFSWLGVMAGIAFIATMYVPFYPFMMFTFGVIAWLMAVIEAMVAAPIVALGITHPEGEGMLGKGEQALMILMNVFLRPSMMIFGYIAGIMMCYVSIWVLNVGFQHVVDSRAAILASTNTWTTFFAGFFSIILYTTLYLTVVQKSFTLIHTLPDKVLRWIGGHAETAGSEAAGWGDESKKSIEKTGEVTDKAAAMLGAELGSKVKGGGSKKGGKSGGAVTAS